MLKESLGYLISRTDKSLKKLITSIVSDYHLTVPQYGILRRLYEQEGLSACDLVKQVYTDSSTMMAILDRLEKKDLIQRIPHAKDRRMNNILLTDRAKEFLPEMIARVIELEKSMTKELSEEELTNLGSGLNKLYEFAISKKP
jgi:DNA-binding MarR family transcriptional regulator